MLFRSKNLDGTFLKKFDPLQGKNFEPVHGFHEGTAWQYAFSVPHDVKGLIKLYGGDKKFTQKLQMVFDDGLFDMGNEPDMHYSFLFSYVKGEEWRAQKETRQLIDSHFKNTPDGLPGNDDCGTMSAWLVYGMMGIYPVCPGDMNYTITTPVFDKISITLDNRFYKGESFQIVKHSDGERIKSISLNKEENPTGYFINHQEVVNGGYLEIFTEDM